MPRARRRCPGRRDARPRVGHVDAAAPGGAALLGRLGVAMPLDLRWSAVSSAAPHPRRIRARRPLRRAAPGVPLPLGAVGARQRRSALCGLEDVGDAPAADASPYDGENCGRATRFKAPRGGIDAPPPPDEEEEGEARWYSMEYALPLAGSPAPSRSWRPRLPTASRRGRVLELKFMGEQRRRDAPRLQRATTSCASTSTAARRGGGATPRRVIEAELQSLDGMPHSARRTSRPPGTLARSSPRSRRAVARRVDPKWAFLERLAWEPGRLG